MLHRARIADVVVNTLVAARERHPHGGELLLDVPGRDANDQPGAGHHIDAGERLGEDDRVVQWQHDDPARHLDRRRMRCHQRQRHRRVEEGKRRRHGTVRRLWVG
jgi:hypothetical protein